MYVYKYAYYSSSTIVAIDDISSLSTLPTLPSVVLNHYADYRYNKSFYFGAYGSPRTGSTALYNILRILIHDKIDPDIWVAFYMSEAWQKFINEEFAILHKAHGSCKNMKDTLIQKKWWFKREIQMFTSYRDVKDQLCSVIKFSSHAIKEKLMKQCEGYAKAYYSCNSAEFKDIRVYEMAFDELILNRSNVIYQISQAMHINDVMNEYDYLRINDELNHLKSATNCGHGNQINQLHCNHISHNKENNCNDSFIFDIIQSSPMCMQLYHVIREKRIQNGYIHQNDPKYPALTK